ncbi:hypothetical protein QL093DRAFT_2267619 [Fusarium oxysporum]|nr:hypothetical protein QL093DRAFT_2267619 [Fusarium oxysporum]
MLRSISLVLVLPLSLSHVLKPTSESARLKPGFKAAIKENLSRFSSSKYAALKDSLLSLVRPIFTNSLVIKPARPTKPT